MQTLRSIRVSVFLFFVVALTVVGIGKLTMIPDNSSAQTNTNTNTKPQTQTAPQSEQEKMLAEITKSIAGKEKQPAETVWKNIQSFKGRPAETIPRVMNAFTRALGVSCSHCHVVGQWEKEDLPTKQIARDMLAMVGKINGELLKNIKNIGGKTQVSCSTCHRGQTIPDNRPPEPKKTS
jgi:hypothetical protein